MAKDKNAPRYDKQGARRVMRKRDYLADLGGQLALGLMCWYCIGNLKGD